MITTSKTEMIENVRELCGAECSDAEADAIATARRSKGGKRAARSLGKARRVERAKAGAAARWGKTTYSIGYLTQRGADGRTWANGHGTVERNIRIVADGITDKSQAQDQAAKLIGAPSPMGTIADAYVLAVSDDGTVRIV